VEANGANPKRLDAAPEWYTSTRTSPFFTNIEHETESAVEEDPPRTYRAPDDSVEVVVRRLAEDEAASVNGVKAPASNFLLRDPESRH
jgi:hypothetical protein